MRTLEEHINQIIDLKIPRKKNAFDVLMGDLRKSYASGLEQDNQLHEAERITANDQRTNELEDKIHGVRFSLKELFNGNATIPFDPLARGMKEDVLWSIVINIIEEYVEKTPSAIEDLFAQASKDLEQNDPELLGLIEDGPHRNRQIVQFFLRGEIMDRQDYQAYLEKISHDAL